MFALRGVVDPKAPITRPQLPDAACPGAARWRRASRPRAPEATSPSTAKGHTEAGRDVALSTASGHVLPVAVAPQATAEQAFAGLAAISTIRVRTVGMSDESWVCRWKLTGHIDVGGFDPGDRFSLNAHASLGYRTALLTRPALLRVGNAVLFQEYEQGDFTGDRFVWNMMGHGPTAGASITF